MTDEAVRRLDDARGLVPRATWIKGVVEDALRTPAHVPLREAEQAVVAAQATPVVENRAEERDQARKEVQEALQRGRRALSSRAAKSGVKPIERG